MTDTGRKDPLEDATDKITGFFLLHRAMADSVRKEIMNPRQHPVFAYRIRHNVEVAEAHQDKTFSPLELEMQRLKEADGIIREAFRNILKRKGVAALDTYLLDSDRDMLGCNLSVELNAMSRNPARGR